MVNKLLLASVIGLAFLLRVIGLSQLPSGFTPDEASFGYDAYSLLKTGKDQWGESIALSLRSFGDFKLPLYAYLTIPSVAVFGLNEFATRLPNAIFGTLAIFATYLMVFQLSRKHNLALLSCLLLAVSPWHISLSRGAFEANLTTFFMPAGIWAFYKGIKNQKYMVLSSLLFGLNLFSYHSARLLTPLIVLSLIFINFKKDKFVSISKYKGAIFVFGMFLFFALYSMFVGGGNRGADVAIFNPTDHWASVADRRYEALLAGLPDLASRLFSNKITYVADQFAGGYFSYLSPQFLFTEGAGERTYGMIPGRGVLYLIEVLFIVAGLFQIVKAGLLKNSSILPILIWIFLSPIPAALAKGPGHAANRAAVMMPALQVFSAYGALVFYNVLVARWKWLSRYVFVVFIIILAVSLLSFLEEYLYHVPKASAESMLYGRKDAMDYVGTVKDNYKEIVISRSLSEPHIYTAFYLQSDPGQYQKESLDWLRYEKEGRSFLDQLGIYRLGKYRFGDIEFAKEQNTQGILFVGKPEEFPGNAKPLKVVYYPNNKPALIIVDPQLR